jgi:hypothetical protein
MGTPEGNDCARTTEGKAETGKSITQRLLRNAVFKGSHGYLAGFPGLSRRGASKRPNHCMNRVPDRGAGGIRAGDGSVTVFLECPVLILKPRSSAASA